MKLPPEVKARFAESPHDDKTYHSCYWEKDYYSNDDDDHDRECDDDDDSADDGGDVSDDEGFLLLHAAFLFIACDVEPYKIRLLHLRRRCLRTMS